MQLSQRKINELKEIIAGNYGVLFSDEKINELGETLLRLARVALNSSAKRIESERRVQVSSTIEKTRSYQRICEKTKPADTQGAFLRPLNGSGTGITPRGSVLAFRPSARGEHLATDDIVGASSNPEVAVSNDHTQSEENGYFVNPSCARYRVFSYIRNCVVARSIQTV